MKDVLLAVLLMGSGCGGPLTADGGVTRMVFVRPVEALLTSEGLQFSRLRNQSTLWWSESGKGAAVTEDAEGFQLFDVPAGPALFEYQPGRFVYSAASRLEPCGESIRGSSSFGNAEVQVDVTLSQPSAPGDSLEVVSSLLPFSGGRLLELDAGSTRIAQRLPWAGRTVLSGWTTVVHRVEALPHDGFVRTTTVGILDAGIIDQFGDRSVALLGTFVPVAAGGDFSIAWDGLSLASLQNSPGAEPILGTFRPAFTALRGGLPLASAWVEGLKLQTRVPLVMPALEPDSFTVSGLLVAELVGGEPFSSLFAWHGPWPDAPEMKAKYHPAREVRIAADGATVSWIPPAFAPGVYEVQLLERYGPGLFREKAIIMTEETSVPIPAELRAPQLTARVVALYGAGLSGETCAQYEHLAAWARIPSVSPLWNP